MGSLTGSEPVASSSLSYETLRPLLSASDLALVSSSTISSLMSSIFIFW